MEKIGTIFDELNLEGMPWSKKASEAAEEYQSRVSEGKCKIRAALEKCTICATDDLTLGITSIDQMRQAKRQTVHECIHEALTLLERRAELIQEARKSLPAMIDRRRKTLEKTTEEVEQKTCEAGQAPENDPAYVNNPKAARLRFDFKVRNSEPVRMATQEYNQARNWLASVVKHAAKSEDIETHIKQLAAEWFTKQVAAG